MSQYADGQGNRDGLGSWLLIILALIIFWPLGLVLLFRKLAGTSDYKGRKKHPYDIRREAAINAAAESGHAPRRQSEPGKKPEGARMPSGRGLTIGGAAMAGVFGLGLVSEVTDALIAGTLLLSLTSIFATLGFCGAGLVMLAAGISRSRKTRRFRRYLVLIGKRECIAVEKLALAMAVPMSRVQNDLQEMLDKGYLPKGYLDYASGMLVLSDEGLRDDKAGQRQQPEPAPAGMEREDAILREIREVNDSIENPELSRKIDRVGEITGRIFAYLRENPDQENRLRSFLNYYLPTTLKILHAYAQMEAQGIEGQNITAAKERIEGMMDKVVDGFEKQLDILFQDKVLDVTSDVAVLEQMLNKDGLAAGEGLRMGG